MRRRYDGSLSTAEYLPSTALFPVSILVALRYRPRRPLCAFRCSQESKSIAIDDLNYSDIPSSNVRTTASKHAYHSVTHIPRRRRRGPIHASLSSIIAAPRANRLLVPPPGTAFVLTASNTTRVYFIFALRPRISVTLLVSRTPDARCSYHACRASMSSGDGCSRKLHSYTAHTCYPLGLTIHARPFHSMLFFVLYHHSASSISSSISVSG